MHQLIHHYIQKTDLSQLQRNPKDLLLARKELSSNSISERQLVYFLHFTFQKIYRSLKYKKLCHRIEQMNKPHLKSILRSYRKYETQRFLLIQKIKSLQRANFVNEQKIKLLRETKT